MEGETFKYETRQIDKMNDSIMRLCAEDENYNNCSSVPNKAGWAGAYE
jgi:hypothetical protein